MANSSGFFREEVAVSGPRQVVNKCQSITGFIWETVHHLLESLRWQLLVRRGRIWARVVSGSGNAININNPGLALKNSQQLLTRLYGELLPARAAWKYAQHRLTGLWGGSSQSECFIRGLSLFPTVAIKTKVECARVFFFPHSTESRIGMSGIGVGVRHARTRIRKFRSMAREAFVRISSKQPCDAEKGPGLLIFIFVIFISCNGQIKRKIYLPKLGFEQRKQLHCQLCHNHYPVSQEIFIDYSNICVATSVRAPANQSEGQGFESCWVLRLSSFLFNPNYYVG